MEKVLTTYYVLIQSMQTRLDVVEKLLNVDKEKSRGADQS